MTAIWDDLARIAAIAGPVCIGLVFAVAGVQKLLHWPILCGVIANYRLLPRPLVAPAAGVLPPAEILLGLLLLTGTARPFASLGAMLLLALFAGAMAINIARGRRQIDCGCNQSFLRQPLRWSLVVRNLVLVLALIPSLPAAGQAPFAALLAGAGAGAAFFMLYTIVNVLAALPGRAEPRLMGA